MRLTSPRVLGLSLIVTSITAGCLLTEPQRADRITQMYVAPNLAECVSLIPTQCMVVREVSSAQWTFFYGAIEGFTHEAGFVHHLQVRIRPIRNPPADGSSLEYRLITAVSKQSCAAIFTPGGTNPEPPDWEGC